MTRQRQTVVMASVIIFAVIAAGILILISGNPTRSNIDYAAIPQTMIENGGYVLGNPDAPVTIVEFADFACPHCQDYKDTMNTFIRDYVVTGKAKFQFHLFPTVGQELTVYAGQIAECVEEEKPGSFWTLYETYYELATTARYSQDMGRIVAERAGVDYANVLNCTATASGTQDGINFARQLQVTGTPAVLIRYGDSQPQYITVNGTTYNRGAVPYAIIEQAVAEASAQ